jgi:NAD(P)-dependent dehydrogenase (short-subunit alcohol dehydrogenase family)
MPVTLITGTSTGIGQATALHLARKGHDVYATMRDPPRGAAPLLDAAKAEGLKLHVSRLDVTAATSCESAVADVLAKAGRIDVLVNNAGIGDLSVVEYTTDDMAREMFETNVFGPLRLMRAVLPGMRERGSGTIVNVSSVAGRVASMGAGLYAGTKHALEAISESVALETRPFGIRVAIIEPGFFNTPIIGKATGAITLDLESPYADAERRIAMIYGSATETGGDPATVAEAIEHAISTTDPTLRYLVGVDARVFVDGRHNDTDEGWLTFGDKKTDDEFWADFARRFPMPTA